MSLWCSTVYSTAQSNERIADSDDDDDDDDSIEADNCYSAVATPAPALTAPPCDQSFADLPALIDDSDSDDDSDYELPLPYPYDSDDEDHSDIRPTALLTVADLKLQFTSAEIKRADDAMRLVRALGHMTEAEAAALVSSNNLINCKITAADIHRAFKIYGGDVSAIKGKTTRLVPNNSVEAIGPIDQAKKLSMHSDVMHFCGSPFLISVVSPLELTLATPLTNEKIESLGAAIQSQLHVLSTKGFYVPELRQ